MYYCECCGIVEVAIEGIYCDGCCDEICQALALEWDKDSERHELEYYSDMYEYYTTTEMMRDM